jgi:hypothetical protein
MASSLQWTGKCCWQSAGANMAECISSTKHSEQRNIKKQEHSEHDCVLWQTRDFWFRAFVCICAVPFHLYNLPCWRDYLWLQHKGSMGCASSLSGFLSDASVAVRTCTAITDLKQTPSQQSLDQMYSYHFRYHTSSGYSLHWFRFKWSLYTSNQMILSSFTPPWHFQSASTAVMEEPTICCASEPFSFLPLPCPASCHGNFLISPCHHVK